MKQQQDENKTLAEMIKNYTDFRNLSNSLMNQEEILLSLNHKNKMQNEEEDEEKYQVYPEKEEEEKAMVEGKKDRVYLDWLDRVETMLSNEEKVLVEYQKIVDRLLSNEVQ